MMGVNGTDSSAYALRSSVAAWLCNETSWKQETVQNSAPGRSFCLDAVIWLQTVSLFTQQHGL